MAPKTVFEVAEWPELDRALEHLDDPPDPPFLESNQHLDKHTSHRRLECWLRAYRLVVTFFAFGGAMLAVGVASGSLGLGLFGGLLVIIGLTLSVGTFPED